MNDMTRTERLLRLARLRGDRAAELIVEGMRARPSARIGRTRCPVETATSALPPYWTEAELRAAWGDR